MKKAARSQNEARALISKRISAVKRVAGKGYGFYAAIYHDTVREFFFRMKKDAEQKAGKVHREMLELAMYDYLPEDAKKIGITTVRVGFINNTVDVEAIAS